MIQLPILDDGYYAAPATWKIILYVVMLGLLLISMGFFRSPAVALMPDVTPKPFQKPRKRNYQPDGFRRRNHLSFTDEFLIFGKQEPKSLLMSAT